MRIGLLHGSVRLNICIALVEQRAMRKTGRVGRAGHFKNSRMHPPRRWRDAYFRVVCIFANGIPNIHTWWDWELGRERGRHADNIDIPFSSSSSWVQKHTQKSVRKSMVQMQMKYDSLELFDAEVHDCWNTTRAMRVMSSSRAPPFPGSRLRARTNSACILLKRVVRK